MTLNFFFLLSLIQDALSTTCNNSKMVVRLKACSSNLLQSDLLIGPWDSQNSVILPQLLIIWHSNLKLKTCADDWILRGMWFSPIILRRQTLYILNVQKWEEDDRSNFASLLLTFKTIMLYGKKTIKGK